MNCPPISEAFIFADDAKLAAQVSCALGQPGVYLPVCDGPRMQRPDRDIEVLRRHNAMGRARANVAYMAGVPDGSFEALRQSLNKHRSAICHRLLSAGDMASAIPGFKDTDEPSLCNEEVDASILSGRTSFLGFSRYW